MQGLGQVRAWYPCNPLIITHSGQPDSIFYSTYAPPDSLSLPYIIILVFTKVCQVLRGFSLISSATESLTKTFNFEFVDYEFTSRSLGPDRINPRAIHSVELKLRPS